MKRQLSREDFDAVRRGLIEAGLNPDCFGFDDVMFLFEHGKSVEDIVKTAVALEHRTTERT